jgi:SAM-dependent methyltransferase
MTAVDVTAMQRFRVAYAEQRAAEGRAYTREDLLALPYLESGPLARQWGVRRRTFDAFLRRVMAPLVATSQSPIQALDLGAGNAWLAYRLALAGCEAIAVDLRDDHVDGLGAADAYLALTSARLRRVVGSFESIPLASASMDVVVFNASLHYAVDLMATLREARRVVRASGRVVILDSPFYASAADGEAMIREKRATAASRFGGNADALLAVRCIEYLTHHGLQAISHPLGIRWTRHRVRYPLWYEARGLRARLRRERVPSRFDLWEGTVA